MKWEKACRKGWGEVQEMIDICDFAVGLSRQLYGLTMHSESPCTGCMNNGTRLAWWVLFRPLIFLWRYGAGMQPLHGFAEMYVYGNLLQKHHFVQLPASILSRMFLKRTMYPREYSNLIVGNEVGDLITKIIVFHLVSATGSTKIGSMWLHGCMNVLGKVFLNLEVTMPSSLLNMLILICCLLVLFLAQSAQRASVVPLREG